MLSEKLTFREWIAREHPDVRLTPMQDEFAALLEQGAPAQWTGGRRSGKAFLNNLWKGYCDYRYPEGVALHPSEPPPWVTR